jgi:hypothetical protein
METEAAFTNLDGAETSLACQVLGLDGHTMQLKLPKCVDIGSPVKVEGNDTLSLGEVSYCCPTADGYLVWVEVLESLRNVTELSRLSRALLT